MKKIFLTVLLSAAAPLWAAEDKLNDMKPEVEKKAVAPTGVEWQNANDKALAAETSDDALAAVVADYEAAENLLAKIKGAYLTDAMVATKIAAVTQYVMAGTDVAWYEFWRTSRNGEREIWCRALIDTAKKTDTAYIKEFCLDQLRWCAKPSHIAEIKEIGSKADKKEVADFAALVVRELENLNSAF